MVFIAYFCVVTVTEKILASTFSLFLKYGIKSVSMDDIARSLGISKKTIYTAVENKKDLVQKVVSTHLKTEEKEINEIVADSSNALEEMIGIAKHVIHLLRQMKPSLIYDLKKYHAPVWDMIEARHYGFIKSVIRNNIHRGQKEGIYRKEVNPEIIAQLYVIKSSSIADEELFDPSIYAKADLAKAVIDYHMYGIVNKTGLQLLEQQNLEH